MMIFKYRLKLEKMKNLDRRLVWESLCIHKICDTSTKEFSAADTLC